GRFTPLKQVERVRLIDGQLSEVVGGPPRFARHDARRPSAPPPAGAPIADDPERYLVKPGRDLSVAAPLVRTPLNHQEHLVNDVLDVEPWAAEPPSPARDVVGVTAVDRLDVERRRRDGSRRRMRGRGRRRTIGRNARMLSHGGHGLRPDPSVFGGGSSLQPISAAPRPPRAGHLARKTLTPMATVASTRGRATEASSGADTARCPRNHPANETSSHGATVWLAHTKRPPAPTPGSTLASFRLVVKPSPRAESAATSASACKSRVSAVDRGVTRSSGPSPATSR